MQVKVESSSIRLLGKLCEIEEQCFDQEAFTKRQIAYLLSDYSTISLVARVNGDIAGFIISQIETENNTLKAHIITINVLPTYRRKGIASEIMKETEDILRKKGITEIYLEAREDNLSALGLYRKMGYQKVGKLEKYYGQKHGLCFKKEL